MPGVSLHNIGRIGSLPLAPPYACTMGICGHSELRFITEGSSSCVWMAGADFMGFCTHQHNIMTFTMCVGVLFAPYAGGTIWLARSHGRPQCDQTQEEQLTYHWFLSHILQHHKIILLCILPIQEVNRPRCETWAHTTRAVKNYLLKGRERDVYSHQHNQCTFGPKPACLNIRPCSVYGD